MVNNWIKTSNDYLIYIFLNYLHGGTGKYGFASDFKFDHSDSLFININGEQRGTGAGTGGALHSINNNSSSPLVFL